MTFTLSFPQEPVTDVEQARIACEHVIQLWEKGLIKRRDQTSSIWVSQHCVFHPNKPEDLCFYEISKDITFTFITLITPGYKRNHLLCAGIKKEFSGMNSHFPIEMVRKLHAYLDPECYERRRNFEDALSAAAYLSGIPVTLSHLLDCNGGKHSFIVHDDQGRRYSHIFKETGEESDYLHRLFQDNFHLGTLTIRHDAEYDAPYVQVLPYFKPRIFNGLDTMNYLASLDKNVTLVPPKFTPN